MTLFFLIILTVSLSIFGFQRFRRRQKKPTIKPSLPKIEELFIQEPKPEWSIPKPVIIEPTPPANPVSPEPANPVSPMPVPEPIVKKETAELPAEPVSLPPKQEPILLSPKDPEPPNNLPVE